jgi:excisionase family DNA binding protein
MTHVDQHVEVLTFEETRAVLRCSKSTLFRLIADGELVGFKLGRSRRFLADEVDAYVQSLSLTRCEQSGHAWFVVQTVHGVPSRVECERDCDAPTYLVTEEKT